MRGTTTRRVSTPNILCRAGGNFVCRRLHGRRQQRIFRVDIRNYFAVDVRDRRRWEWLFRVNIEIFGVDVLIGADKILVSTFMIGVDIQFFRIQNIVPNAIDFPPFPVEIQNISESAYKTFYASILGSSSFPTRICDVLHLFPSLCFSEAEYDSYRYAPILGLGVLIVSSPSESLCLSNENRRVGALGDTHHELPFF